MHRKSFPRALLLALLAVVAMLPSTASAAKPEREFEHFFNVDENVDICGINVDIVNEGVFTGRAFFDDQGNFVRFIGVASGTTTFTADNGKSLIVKAAGTITFFSTIRGVPELIRTPGGGVITRDAGLITFAETHDLDTGDFISFEVISISGPHPEAESDFELFCDVFTAALA